jgi:hypothetical protein
VAALAMVFKLVAGAARVRLARLAQVAALAVSVSRLKAHGCKLSL